MIVWGGLGEGQGALRNGGRYNPATDTWSTTRLSIPEERYGMVAVWTGTEFIVWGGGMDGCRTGGRYNPTTDVWVQTNWVSAPSPRRYPAGVWTGSEMIVWGGEGLNDGGR